MSTSQLLHASALRISILHILRAYGFHSTKPSVLDTLVNLTERYLLLLATSTAEHALSNHNSLLPDITDVRMALTSCGSLLPVHGGAEEGWTERLRKPLSEYDDMAFGEMRREKEAARRAEDDAADVAAFVAWVTGDRNREIRRVAGMLGDATGAVAGVAGPAAAGPGTAVGQDDFLTGLKKKGKALVDEERWAGTILGKDAEDRDLIIEGGEVGGLNEWGKRLVERDAKAGKVKGDNDVEMVAAPG